MRLAAAAGKRLAQDGAAGDLRDIEQLPSAGTRRAVPALRN
jgi:hypothetical protein